MYFVYYSCNEQLINVALLEVELPSITTCVATKCGIRAVYLQQELIAVELFSGFEQEESSSKTDFGLIYWT